MSRKIRYLCGDLTCIEWIQGTTHADHKKPLTACYFAAQVNMWGPICEVLTALL